MDMLPPLTFEIPSPISLNNAYMDVVNPHTLVVRRVPTKEAIAFKEAVAWSAKVAANQVRWEYREGMQIELGMLVFFKDRRRRDLSNRIKLAEDAIAEVLGFDDTWMTISKVVVESGGIDARPRAIVTLRATLPATASTTTSKERKGHVRQRPTKSKSVGRGST